MAAGKRWFQLYGAAPAVMCSDILEFALPQPAAATAEEARPLTLELYCFCPDAVDQAAAGFKEMYANLAEWDAKFRAQAADLTENANDWQRDAVEEGEEYQELTEADFRRRITISEFSLNPEGEFSVYYDDDNLFWGHVIIVEGNVEGRLEEAYIAG